MRTELWSTIGSAFPDNKGLSCRIIVTTPIQSIAYACSSEDRYIYKMRGLGKKHSAQLFKRKGPKVELEQAQILKKCDGLPLALVSIAQFMSKKCVPNGTSCKDVCNRLGYYLETDKDTLARMQGVLAKNYASLHGHELKACLLYLGLFPSEHPIRKKRLLRRWLAEGLVETQDLAVMNFQEFIDRNITRPIDVSYNEKVKTCRTCGIMLEWIRRKSVSQDFITLCCDGIVKLLCDQGGRPKCVRRLCLHRGGTAHVSLGNVSLVRSLTIFNEADETLVDFGNYQLLRVLDLEECNNLSEEKLRGIGNLLLLKYLSLGGTITKLPIEIANLEFLQTLDIRRTNVRTLPIDVMSLPFLVHLLGKFRLTGKAKQMSKAEQFLSSGKSNLQTLAGFIVGESEGFLQLLSHMNNLRKIKAWCESISGSNGTVHLVETVQKYIQDNDEEEQTNQDDRSMSLHFKVSSLDFHSLKGPCYLSSLKLHGMLGTALPPFVSLLSGLRELCLSTSTLTADILATVSKLCYLQYLKLIADQIEEFFIEARAFPKLLRLCLVLQHPTNNILVINEGALSKLVALQLLFEGLNDPSGINIAHLKSLKEVTLHPDQTIKLDQWQQAARDHPNRLNVELMGTIDPMDIDAAENSPLQDEKSTPENVTQRPLQDHSSSSTRLKVMMT
ncbi:disease resistance protein RGA4-like [Miscanthus floridulus]|uniref:disease resistance protein RGA4-like n=1 Tax=Miscanthus floridulus TaxID=154761 RepID=UPI00345938A6